MLGLTLIWVYDLNLYTVVYLRPGRRRATLFEWRGVCRGLDRAAVRLATRSRARCAVKLSRAATFQSLSLLAHLRLFRGDGDPRDRVSRHRRRLVVGADGRGAAAMTVGAMVLHPQSPGRAAGSRSSSPSTCSSTATIIAPNGCASPRHWAARGLTRRRLSERIVRAFADIVDAPGGLLLVSDGGRGISQSPRRWNWPGGQPARRRLEESRRILERARAQRPHHRARRRCATAGPKPRTRRSPCPQWLLDEASAWAGIPLAPPRAADRPRDPRRARIPPPARLGGFRPAAHRRQPGGELARRGARARKRSPTRSGSRNSTAASRSSFTTSRIWSASCRCSRAMPSGTPTIPSSAPTWWRRCKASVGKMNELLARLAPAFAGARPADRGRSRCGRS